MSISPVICSVFGVDKKIRRGAFKFFFNPEFFKINQMNRVNLYPGSQSSGFYVEDRPVEVKKISSQAKSHHPTSKMKIVV